MRQSHGCENLNCDLRASLFMIGIRVTKVNDIRLMNLSPIKPMLLLRVIPMAAMMFGCEGEGCQINQHNAGEEFW